MSDNKKLGIGSRINKALLSLSFVLSLVFGLLIFLLLYVIEDQIFVNLLRAEQSHFNRLSSSQAVNWQPSNRHMKLVSSKEQLPEKLQSVVSTKSGVYEFFENDQAYFILYGQKQYSNEASIMGYYITFDVSELLAVREGRLSLISTIIIVTLIVMFIAILVSFSLSRKILAPLKKLSNQLQKHGFSDLPKGFSLPFAGDEVGVLAAHLEEAIEQAQSATQREFEFNRGVSHELRTPIQVALNSVELLEITDKNLKNDKTIKRLKRSVAQMEQISEAFLWLASQRSLEKKTTNPMTVLKTLKQHYLQQYPSQMLNINNELGDSLLYSIPRSVFTVIIDNLLRNAFQHGAGGNIMINLNENAIQILNLKSLVGKISDEDETKGYGIGLMIVKRICQRLNWELNFKGIDDKFFKTEISFNHSNEKINNN